MALEKYNSQNIIRDLKSDVLRELAIQFVEKNIQITFYGKAWSNVSVNWIYFDIIMDLEKIRDDFNLNESIVSHENLDPRSGMEKGFIDTRTGEGIMGKVK